MNQLRPDSPPSPPTQWTWPALSLALIWAAIVRLPIVLNVGNHLDSDLAVDGLTLVEMFKGHWRWHYPGTPHVGTASLLAMAPFGTSLMAVALGGLVISLLVLASVFWLTHTVFGRRAALFSLVPLTFASTGTIWLSSRITGGHLLAVAWYALALGMLHRLMDRGGAKLAGGLGVVCGLSVWSDSMALVALGAMLVVAGIPWLLTSRSRSGIREAGLCGLGLLIGLLPKFAGDFSDPYDAYQGTFARSLQPDVLKGHARILVLDCLPRLVAGHRIPGLQAEPGGISPDGKALPAIGGSGTTGWVATLLGIGLFLPAMGGLMAGSRATLTTRAIMLIVTGLVVVSFIINRNIFNSDNYRYLVFLLVPWAIGLGRLLDLLSQKGAGGMAASIGLACVFSLVFTLDLVDWYRHLGWINDGYRPIVAQRDEPVLEWLNAHPEATSLSGEYWDVYRLSMLSGGRVRGIPTPHYPNRFPEWSQALPNGHASHVLTRRTAIGGDLNAEAKKAGGRELLRCPGGVIVDWP